MALFSASAPRISARFRTAFKLAAAALFLFATGGPAVIAEGGDDTARRFLRESGARPFWAGPVVQRARRPVARGTSAPRYQRFYASRSAREFVPGPAAPVVEPTFFITVMGDSLGQMLAQGLQEGLADRPEILVRRKARESSGLVRDDFYDWLKAARDIAGGTERVDFALMMVGANDRQALRDASGSYEPRSDKWREIYSQRVEDISAIFRDKKIPLIWVGLPVMRSERMAADAVYFNDIFRERAAKAGATYIDTWEAFVDDKGQFNAYGPDFSGQTVKLRAGDGIHFTKAGARKLAHFAESDIRRAAGNVSVPVDLAALPQILPGAEPALPRAAADPDAPIDANAVISAQIRREAAAGVALPNLQAALPLPELPQALNLPVKPPAGAIVPLTGPALSPGGVLATRANRQSAALGGEALALIERTLADGRPIDAKQGRADDFSWPRR